MVWIGDIIAVLRCRTVDRDGRCFQGRHKHRVIAWVMTAALFAGRTSVAAIAATPAITAAAGAAKDALFPEPAPVSAWAVLAKVKATEQPTVLNISGDRLRLSFAFPGPA